MGKNKVLIAQLGARKHYQEPRLFHQWGVLGRLCTDFYAGNGWFTESVRKKNIYQKLPKLAKKGLDRYDPTLKGADIKHFPVLAYRYLKALKYSSTSSTSAINIKFGKKFCSQIIQTGLDDMGIVYGFDGASLELFEYAKSKGIRCILDQTVAERALIHKLLLEEEELWLDWSKKPFTIDSADYSLVERQQKEQKLADNIICGSDFVKSSLVNSGINSSKISVVSLGNYRNDSIQHINPKKYFQKHRELRILFAGAVCLRKGIQYLLQALKKIKGEIPFVCKAVGALQIRDEKVVENSDVCDFLGLIPRSQMKEIYAWADVFVLPSICEGSAMVIYEALSSGLPIITTYNSGSIVRDGTDGYIVPIRDSIEIANKLRLIYDEKLPQRRIEERLKYAEKTYIEACENLKACVYDN